MKRTCTLALIASFVGISSIANAADDIPTLFNLWHAHKYDEALPRLLAYRKGPVGRVWRVDYMIGTTECHGFKKSDLGIAYLKNIFVYKDATDDARATARLEIEFCKNTSSGASAPEQPPDDRVAATGQVTPDGPSVSGKGGFNMIPDSRMAGTTESKPVPVPAEELRQRVFAADQAPAALIAAQKLLGPGSKGATANGFVVVCSGSCEGFVTNEVAKCLARYWAPLEQQFDIRRPEKLITVYVPPELRDVPTYARKLHGVELPFGTIAYSVREDLSVVGLMGMESCGSLAHELVHLSIKNNFGDSPAWLEEGLAAEVAVARPEATRLVFESSWRDKMLQTHMPQRPTLAQLLDMTWTDFAALDPASVEHVAAIHAMAAVFIRYLDARGKLKDVYFAIRDGRFPQDGGDPRTDVAIVEQVLGKKAAAIDTDVMKWFATQPH